MKTVDAMADTRSRNREMPDPEELELGADAGGLREHEDAAPEQAATAAELAEANDKLLRALAEQQNIRRQMRQEREEAVKYAASRVAEDLLDTLDNLRRAIDSATEDTTDSTAIQRVLSGVEATERNLLAALARHGVQKIDPLGEAFDPHRHHAMFQRPQADAAEGTVIEVLQPGYMIHDRLLRPAMVGVASAPES
jgi:molecular chaperone GrpE